MSKTIIHRSENQKFLPTLLFSCKKAKGRQLSSERPRGIYLQTAAKNGYFLSQTNKILTTKNPKMTSQFCRLINFVVQRHRWRNLPRQEILPWKFLSKKTGPGAKKQLRCLWTDCNTVIDCSSKRAIKKTLLNLTAFIFQITLLKLLSRAFYFSQ